MPCTLRNAHCRKALKDHHLTSALERSANTALESKHHHPKMPSKDRQVAAFSAHRIQLPH